MEGSDSAPTNKVLRLRASDLTATPRHPLGDSSDNLIFKSRFRILRALNDIYNFLIASTGLIRLIFITGISVAIKVITAQAISTRASGGKLTPSNEIRVMISD